jgi:hypothetical protein
MKVPLVVLVGSHWPEFDVFEVGKSANKKVDAFKVG